MTLLDSSAVVAYRYADDARVTERAATLQGVRKNRSTHGPSELRTTDALILATTDAHEDIDAVIGGDAKIHVLGKLAESS